MSNIDRQRYRAVALLERRGYSWDGLEWMPPDVGPDLTREADKMHALLMNRAAALTRCTGGTDHVAELSIIGEALQAYEVKRWPMGKIEGGKG